jgi:non-homologous end joining protein Ku
MRAAQAGVVVNLGMMSMVGSLHTIESTESKKAPSFKNCCKECYETGGIAQPINQRNHCENGHGPFGSEGILKGKEGDDGTLAIVGTAEEVKEAKAASLEIKKIDLVIHNADEWDAAVFPGAISYLYLPAQGNDLFSALIAAMDEDGRILCDDGVDRVLTGALRVRDVEHVVRATKWNEHLVFNSVLRPEQVKEFPASPAGEVSEKNLGMIRTLVALSTEPFDPDNYRDENRARLAQWVAARRTGVTVQPQPTTKAGKPKGSSLDDMLAAAVAAAQSKAG